MKHLRFAPLLAVASAIAFGCANPIAPDAQSVGVHLGAAGVVLTNRTDADVFYMVVEREMAVLIDWIGCTDPGSACPRVAPSSSTVVPYDQVFGWPGSGQVIVYWWHLVPASGGGFRQDSMRAVVRGPGPWF